MDMHIYQQLVPDVLHVILLETIHHVFDKRVMIICRVFEMRDKLSNPMLHLHELKNPSIFGRRLEREPHAARGDHSRVVLQRQRCQVRVIDHGDRCLVHLTPHLSQPLVVALDQAPLLHKIGIIIRALAAPIKKPHKVLDVEYRVPNLQVEVKNMED